MKKVLLFLVIAMAVLFVSCDRDSTSDSGMSYVGDYSQPECHSVCNGDYYWSSIEGCYCKY